MVLAGAVGLLLDLVDVLVDAFLALPAPVRCILLLVALFLAFGRSSFAVKPDAPPDSKPSDDPTDPTVSFCRSLGAPDFPHEEGSFVPATEFILNNTSDALPFRNDFADGKFLALHRATYDSELNKSGQYAFGKYFLGKKRLWEARVQFRFKKPPRVEDLYFGIELEKYVPMDRATKRSMEMLVSLLKRVVGKQIYHSPGDNPEVSSGELERPVFAMPLWAFDQFIVTPEGQVPPNLTDPAVPSMGSCRYKRVRRFKEELDRLEFRVGPTYTFCFWGISQWLDKLNWVIKMPFTSALDFNLFCGSPPVHVVIYSLKNQQNGAEAQQKRRHLHSLKQYYFDAAFWSSKSRPPLDRIQALLKDTGEADSPTEAEPAAINPLMRNLSKRSGGGNWFSCCSGRP